ncbi:hypothetical protein [Streptomyces sp. NPDC093094]|uniref:hypothetical protein n=1 Tax=Streptomyces sp. NPDC093094 TaxID=3366026 RepID=UPI0037F8E81C
MTEVTGQAGGTTAPLLASEDRDRLGQRLRHAVAEFVDGPRHAVEEADRTLEEIAARFTDAVTRRRRTLRSSWQSGDAPGAGADDTERLRLALRDYRELAEILLHEGGGDGRGNGHGDGRTALTGTGAGGRTDPAPEAADRQTLAKPQERREEPPAVTPAPPTAEPPQHTDPSRRFES